jgi:predicted enzyme related to lactoylglutathione lyase
MHRSRLCHFVIDIPDLDQGVSFWSAALNAVEEPLPEISRHIYRRLRIPDSEVRILLQKTNDEKTAKERMHLDLETDDVEAEVGRLEALGASRWDHQVERGFDFWVLRDPWGNEFCVLQPEFPELLARQEPRNQELDDTRATLRLISARRQQTGVSSSRTLQGRTVLAVVVASGLALGRARRTSAATWQILFPAGPRDPAELRAMPR